MRKQSGVLDDVAHTAAQLDRVLVRGGFAFEADLAGIGRDQTVHGLEQRCLTRAAAAQQDDRFARGDAEAHIAQHGPAVDGIGQVADLENAFGHRGR